MVHGRAHRDGTIEITWNAQEDSLQAPVSILPNGHREYRHYLPCSGCGIVEAVRSQIVTFLCRECADKHDEECRCEGKREG